MDRRRLLSVSLAGLTGFAGLFGSIPFLRSFLPSARARALGDPIQIDVTQVSPGRVKAYQYRGETILVLHRTQAMLGQLELTRERALDSGAVGDPSYVDSRHRAIDPAYLVIRGVCTHLGCVPQLKADEGKRVVGDWWTGGFVCPCHQSAFDYAGRVIRGPAPRNLPVPPHRYAGATRLIIGEEAEPT